MSQDIYPSQPRIDLVPQRALADEPLQVQLIAMPPQQVVTLRARMAGPPGHHWVAQASFATDAHGHVDLTTARPRDGTYSEPDPMSLIWSMQLQPATEPVLGSAADPWAPAVIAFEVERDGQQLAQATAERLRVAPDVRRTVVREHGLVGTLFQPPGTGPYAPVILLGGSEGGLHEPDAALLASQGYTVLALAYFGMESLPSGLVRIPLEYFATAFAWLQARPAVRADRLGVVGGSRGGELALLLGATFPAVTAVVSYAGSGVLTQGIGGGSILEMVNTGAPSWTYQGQALPYLPMRATPGFEAQVRAGTPVALRQVFDAALENSAAVAAATIPVEQIQGPVLLISAGDDQLWPCGRLTELAAERLRRFGHAYADHHLHYARAGHGIIPPPYGPTTSRTGPGPGVEFALGGTAAADAHARADAWSRLRAFLAEQLG